MKQNSHQALTKHTRADSGNDLASKAFQDELRSSLEPSLRKEVEKIALELIEKELPIVDESVILGRYEFKERLGDGATSQVKRAVNKETWEEVAIKIMNVNVVRLNRGLIREIKILKQLDHPNIIKLIEVLRTEDKFFIVMELARGEVLFDALVSRKSYTEGDARLLVGTILSALAHMHKLGIAHRDLKPENIILGNWSDVNKKSNLAELKIVDFGFSCQQTEEDAGMSTPTGTLGYKAPELVKKEVHSMAVDMWSLGVLTYILLCGFPPFFSCADRREDTDFVFNTPFWYFFNQETPDLESAILSGQHDYPDPFWTNISHEAKAFVSALLQVDASKRLTAKQALDDPWIKDTGKSKLRASMPLTVHKFIKYTATASTMRRSLQVKQMLSEEASESPRDLMEGIAEEPDSSAFDIDNNETVPNARSLSKAISTNQAEKWIPKDQDKDKYPNRSSSVDEISLRLGLEQMALEEIKAGWMEIRTLGVWVRRYFVLYNNLTIRYFKTEKADIPNCFGLIKLDEVAVKPKPQMRSIEIVHRNKKPIFSSKVAGSNHRLPSVILHYRSSTALLRVKDDQEMVAWMACIQRAIERVPEIFLRRPSLHGERKKEKKLTRKHSKEALRTVTST